MNKKISQPIYMNDLNLKNLENLSKKELIKIILSLKVNQPRISKPQSAKTTPGRVRDMIQDYEDNIIQPPPEFRDNNEENIIKSPPEFRDPAPMTQIKQVDKALKGYTKSYEIGINNNKNPLEQLQNTRSAIKHHINTLLDEMKGLKFVEALKVTFRKVSNDEIIYKTAYFNSKTQTIINETQINEALQLSKQIILNKIAQWVSEGSGWIIQSVDNHYLNIVKYNQ